ncbi:MAG: CC0125/CC1285 family lipoprotein [Alphaproteobacteria bacterium]
MHARARPYLSTSLLAAVGLLLAACASGPSYPLYSPSAVTGTFGFSEQRVADNSYKVTYVSPTRQAADSRAAIDDRRQSLLTLTNDLALWRAADLALANGQKEFRVTRRDNDVDVQRSVYDSYPYYQRGRRYGPPYRPYYGPNFYGPPWPDTSVWLRATTSLIVEFGRKPGEEFYFADDAIARLRQTYPGADQPVMNK